MMWMRPGCGSGWWGGSFECWAMFVITTRHYLFAILLPLSIALIHLNQFESIKNASLYSVLTYLTWQLSAFFYSLRLVPKKRTTAKGKAVLITGRDLWFVVFDFGFTNWNLQDVTLDSDTWRPSSWPSRVTLCSPPVSPHNPMAQRSSKVSLPRIDWPWCH